MKRHWIAAFFAIACASVVAISAATADAGEVETAAGDPPIELVFVGIGTPESETSDPSSESVNPLSAGNCPSHTFCAYTEEEFNGVESHTDCSNDAIGTHGLGGIKHSAVNNCENRVILLQYAGAPGEEVCMEPFGQRNRREYNQIYESAEGFRCPG